MGTTGLTNRAAPLEMTPEEFRRVGHRLVDDIVGFLESLPRRPVAQDEAPAAVRDTFSYAPPYYRFDGEEEDPRVNYFELGLQNSRGFRASRP